MVSESVPQWFLDVLLRSFSLLHNQRRLLICFISCIFHMHTVAGSFDYGAFDVYKRIAWSLAHFCSLRWPMKLPLNHYLFPLQLLENWLKTVIVRQVCTLSQGCRISGHWPPVASKYYTILYVVLVRAEEVLEALRLLSFIYLCLFIFTSHRHVCNQETLQLYFFNRKIVNASNWFRAGS